jgi:hypothetical protein
LIRLRQINHTLPSEKKERKSEKWYGKK